MGNLRLGNNQMLGFYPEAIAESEKPFSERDLERAGLFSVPYREPTSYTQWTRQ